MLQTATAPRPALRFVVPAEGPTVRMPYFPQSIPVGFPSPAGDHLQKVHDLHDLVKHPAATFFAHVQGDSMNDANLQGRDLPVITPCDEQKKYGKLIQTILQACRKQK